MNLIRIRSNLLFLLLLLLVCVPAKGVEKPRVVVLTDITNDRAGDTPRVLYLLDPKHDPE